MYKALSIQFKILLLLCVFSFNMVVGFACAIGVDMRFNTRHHHEGAEHKHSHKDTQDDCCNNKVLKISQADKEITPTTKLLSPAFFISFIAVYYNINISYPSQGNTSTKYFVRGHHPPIPDVRISIQSFQI